MALMDVETQLQPIRELCTLSEKAATDPSTTTQQLQTCVDQLEHSRAPLQQTIERLTTLANDDNLQPSVAQLITDKQGVVNTEHDRCVKDIDTLRQCIDERKRDEEELYGMTEEVNNAREQIRQIHDKQLRPCDVCQGDVVVLQEIDANIAGMRQQVEDKMRQKNYGGNTKAKELVDLLHKADGECQVRCLCIYKYLLVIET